VLVLEGIAGALLFVMGRRGVGWRTCELILLVSTFPVDFFED
jgi:hypothetical protein